MKKIAIHVWHNLQGEIVAIGHSNGTAKCVPLADRDQSILETHIEEEHIAKLHHTHMVDLNNRCLVELSAAKSPRS